MAQTSGAMNVDDVIAVKNDNFDIHGIWLGTEFIWPDPWRDVWDEGTSVLWENVWHNMWSESYSTEALKEMANGSQQRT